MDFSSKCNTTKKFSQNYNSHKVLLSASFKVENFKKSVKETKFLML